MMTMTSMNGYFTRNHPDNRDHCHLRMERNDDASSLGMDDPVGKPNQDGYPIPKETMTRRYLIAISMILVLWMMIHSMMMRAGGLERYNEEFLAVVGGEPDRRPEQQQQQQQHQHQPAAEPPSILRWSSLSSYLRKKFPDPFKPMHNGKITYVTEAIDNEDQQWLYHRDIVVPCDYGLLTFKVAPANRALPYLFDVYEDEFSYKDMICPLKKSRTVSKTSTVSFLEPDDPTLIIAKFNYLTKISSKVLHPIDGKTPSPEALAYYGGDYVVIARGRFYDANVYRQLLDIVHNWTDATTTLTTSLADTLTATMSSTETRGIISVVGTTTRLH